MATGKVQMRTITKMVPTETSVPVYTLTLNKREAEFLHFLLGTVGGSPTNSPRKFCLSTREALRSCGIHSDDYKLSCLESRNSRTLYFLDAMEYEYPRDMFLDE